MVARTPDVLKGDEIEVGIWNVYEVEVSTNDTIPCSEFDSSVALDIRTLVKKSDRTAVTTTVALNVITVTGAGLTNEKCILFVSGVSA